MLARMAIAVALTAGAASAQFTYDITGESGFIQDLDSGDGFDARNDLAGTWTGQFTIANSDDLTFVSNVQSQGGSRTTYSGVVLNSLSLQTVSGDIVVTDTPVTGELVLWDRASFSTGQKILDLEFTIGNATIEFSFSTLSDDLAHDQLFTIGTPDPNLPIDAFLPGFDNPSDFGALYRSAGVSVDDDGTTQSIFPGRSRYNGETLTFAPIPSPASSGLLAMAGLVAARRRRA